MKQGLLKQPLRETFIQSSLIIFTDDGILSCYRIIVMLLLLNLRQFYKKHNFNFIPHFADYKMTNYKNRNIYGRL